VDPAEIFGDIGDIGGNNNFSECFEESGDEYKKGNWALVLIIRPVKAI
jgi:hypothetical protein